MMLGYKCGEDVPLSDSKLLEAKDNLQAITFFGLTEHYNTSVCLFMRTVGQVPLESDFITFRKSRSYDHNVAIPPTTLKILQRAEKYDVELYKFAKKLFFERVASSGLKVVEEESE